MDFGAYARYSVVAISGLVLFFMGTLLPLLNDYELIALFGLFVLTIFVCFHNKTPLGGLFYGLFTSASFLIGNLVTSMFIELSYLISLGIPLEEQGLTIFINTIWGFLPEIFAFFLAFTSLGFFFGTLGYIFSRTAPETILNPPRHYRDYWSSIHSLGKSDKREFSNLDRRFNDWDATKKGWWDRVASRVTLPQPDLLYMPHKKVGATAYRQGDLYDLSTGRMLGSGLADPDEVISKYKPFVLKIPEYSTNTKGVRRLVFETLLANFLEKIVPSRISLVLFAVLSAIFLFSVYLGQAASPIFAIISWLPLTIAVAFSVVTLFFVWEWRKRSMELFKKRPDERLLILIVYLVLALLYGFYYQIILNFPTTTAGWVGAWLIWAEWSVVLSVILGLGYIFIHREVEAINTYFYDNRERTANSVKTPAYKDPSDEPYWLKDSTVNYYWVIRFMYFWRYEVAKVPHPDWERVELWVDAEKGALEWVVSDYHYREMWYRVRGDLPSLYISFFLNFHTPIPILERDEVDAIGEVLDKANKTLLKTAIIGRSQEIIEHIDRLLDKEFWRTLHPSKWISDYGLQNVAADFSSKLPWRFWRYPRGLEEPENYIGKPAAKPEEEPQQIPETSK